jgi:hypothetical protein
MLSALKFLFFFIILLGALNYAYTSWFRPEDYLRRVNTKRSKSPKNNIFVLIQLPSANYLRNHRGADIWLARLASLLMVLISLIALIALAFST